MQETIEDKRNGGLRARNTEKEMLIQRKYEVEQELSEPETEHTI